LNDPVQKQLEQAAGEPGGFPATPQAILPIGVTNNVIRSHARPTIPDHELLRVVGQGAYGDVWLARNVLGEYRAVKVVWRRDFSGDERPFEREFEGIKRFEPISRSHPSQLAILHVGKNDEAGYFYYVMELADDAEAKRSNGVLECRSDEKADQVGVPKPRHSTTPALQDPNSYAPLTLRRLMRDRGPLPAAECLEIARSLASALAHLHAQGLVHRDVKPSNVIFVRGVPKLADIGLVTSADDARSFVGTEGYVPPEGPGTASADCYSLGKLLYELSTGHDRTAWPQPAADVATRPDRNQLLELNAILHRACAPDAGQRYVNGKAMLAELELLQAGKSVRHRRTLDRWLAAFNKAALASAVLALVLAVGWLALRRSLEDYPPSKVPKVNDLIKDGNYIVFGNLTEQGVSNAVVCFTRAAQLDPSYLPAHWGLYAAYSRRAIMRGEVNPPELRAQSARLTELAPGSTEALSASSFVKWFDWDFRGALTDARLATQRRGASKEADCGAHLYYGYFLLENGNPVQEALREFRIAERLNRLNPYVYQHLGNAYAVARDFDQALENYQHCLDMHQRHYVAHLRKGRIYDEVGNFAAAIQEYEEFDQAAGNYDSARRDFYDQLLEANRQDGAKGYWSKRLEIALKVSRSDPYYVATLYARLPNKKADAYAWLKQACDQQAFSGGLMTDLCWDHNDEDFKRIASRIVVAQ
jgi:serine/threonine protein kinase